MKIYSISFTAVMMALLWVSLNLPDLGNNVNLIGRVNSAVKSKKPMGASWSGSRPANSGYYNYGNYAVDATGLPNGAAIVVNFSAQNVPNRFYLQDNCGLGDWRASNSSYNGYVGDATYPGPWGMSMNTFSGGQLTLLKRNGCNSYRLTVETSTGPYNDQWTASY